MARRGEAEPSRFDQFSFRWSGKIDNLLAIVYFDVEVAVAQVLHSVRIYTLCTFCYIVDSCQSSIHNISMNVIRHCLSNSIDSRARHRTIKYMPLKTLLLCCTHQTHIPPYRIKADENISNRLITNGFFKCRFLCASRFFEVSGFMNKRVYACCGCYFDKYVLK